MSWGYPTGRQQPVGRPVICFVRPLGRNEPNLADSVYQPPVKETVNRMNRWVVKRMMRSLDAAAMVKLLYLVHQQVEMKQTRPGLDAAATVNPLYLVHQQVEMKQTRPGLDTAAVTAKPY